ncbi:cis-prenyltransferase 4, chloroplastic-like isoform X1 [Prosopis cineraria]|uniref:cis-prenyltransferase 4, chloroplastic-like isoform X1 n=1 Tax=Prosopis cineraria TaxID=364024 RepID=UPI0024107830|nr:cis-prenyltransferase 4, chloroplastic-like isoform X1 [Prosopis cineraria]
MFLLHRPILVHNTLIRLPKPHHALTYSRFQTTRVFNPSPFPNFQSRRTTVLPPRNVTVFSTSSLREPEPFPPELRPELMPKHVAVIMDGNRRWAKIRGLPAPAGHEAGLQTMRRIIDLCCDWGIKVLTLFWFSCDNWARPKEEVDYLMSLFERTIAMEIETYKSQLFSWYTCYREGIQISVIGDTLKLPASLQRTMISATETTKQNSRLQLLIAVSYSGRYDVVEACKAVAEKVKDGVVQVEDINEGLIEKELETKWTGFPNPDLMIRTGGELRVSNFLLWQMAYTELFFDPHLWPDYGKDQFVEALASFQHRQRRFGGSRS